MNRSLIAALAIPLFLVAACRVSDQENGATTISLDENLIEAGAEEIANEAAGVAAVAGNKIENAGPEIEKSAADIKERAGRVADKADALGDEIDASTTTPAEANSAR